MHLQRVRAAGERHAVHSRFVRLPGVEDEFAVDPDACAVIRNYLQCVVPRRQIHAPLGDKGKPITGHTFLDRPA